MMMTGRSGKRCFRAWRTSSPELPGMRISETRTWGAPAASSASMASFACANVLKGMPSRASAFSKTQRIERSSSMTQTGFILVSLAKRQHDAETGPSRLALAFHDPLVLLDESLRERQAEPGPTGAPRDQGIEDLVPYFLRYARSVVDHLQF